MNVTKLYIGNLAYDIEGENLKADFSDQIGEIIDAFVLKDKNGKSRGFGFIKVKNEDAQKFLSLNNKAVYSNRTLIVKEAIEKKKIEIKRHNPEKKEEEKNSKKNGSVNKKKNDSNK